MENDYWNIVFASFVKKDAYCRKRNVTHEAVHQKQYNHNDKGAAISGQLNRHFCFLFHGN